MLKLALLALVGVVVAELSVYETPENIKSNGYPAESHHVTTSDGYILEMHRIPHGKGQSYSSARPVIFLMHGLTAASNSYILLGPDLAPAYNFADAGFDVWMGNARGTKNSRHHVSLNPDDSKDKIKFFDFSWEEIAVYDLPAMIDYALAKTNKEKLFYIGHSQGGTAFLVLNSMKPEYQKKIQSAHLWAGVGYMEHFPNTQLSLIARFTNTIFNTAVLARQVELYPPSSEDTKSAQSSTRACVGDTGTAQYLCHVMDAGDFVGRSATDGAGSDEPGAALKQLAHYGQNIRDKSFARWSYGTIQNLFNYGQTNPPRYDLSLIEVDVTMHYTVNDNLLDEKDVLGMAAVMPNTKVRKVARETFLHGDFVVAKDAKTLVTDYVVQTLRREAGL